MIRKLKNLYNLSPRENLRNIAKIFGFRSQNSDKTGSILDYCNNCTANVINQVQLRSITGFLDIDFNEIEFYQIEYLDGIEKQLNGQIVGTDYQKSEMTFKERAFINGIIRRTNPKTIVEIGVSAGGSTCVILNAIRDRKEAKLYSFDYNTVWYRDLHMGQNTGRNTGFLVEEILPEQLSKWELKTGGVPSNHFDVLPDEGIDLCFIDTAHTNPGEHLNILEVLPHMKKNGIIIYHDTAYHTVIDPLGETNCISMNTLHGKRIKLSSESTEGLPNIGAIVLDGEIEDMIYGLFTNLSLPWAYCITEEDFLSLFKHFSQYYSKENLKIFFYYYVYYLHGGFKNKEFSLKLAELYTKSLWS